MNTEIAEPTVALLQLNPKQSANFWTKVEKTDGCWNWIAAKDDGGYGHFQVNSKFIFAHRLSYLLHVGPIPEGICVCHTCDNPSCVNPNHLWLGTNTDNVHDMIAKGRSVFPANPFKNGTHMCCEGHRDAKLTNKEVCQIRQESALKLLSQRQLAKKFGVSGPMICKIVNRKRWRFL